MSLSERPKVSVVTVCFNSEEFLERTIKSVLSQTYEDIEYIIIDGGSKDRTLEILDKYKSKIGYLLSEQDEGIFDAMNKGIIASKGEILCFLNSDDYFYNIDAVKNAVDFFKKRKKVDFIYGDMLYHDPRAKITWRYRYPRFIMKIHFIGDSIGHPATFFSRAAFEKTGYYDTRFKIAGDCEWFLRALYRKRSRAMYTGQIVSVFQYGGISNSDAHRKLRLMERKMLFEMYFNFFELLLAKILNFILFGDLFRSIAKFILRPKGYNFLKNIKRNSFSSFREEI
ncbi:MAG: glycosyltransferase family 2 protein [Candidatus Omnitrophota bacterium]